MIHIADKTESYASWLERLQCALDAGQVVCEGDQRQGQIIYRGLPPARVPVARTIPNPIELRCNGADLVVVPGRHPIRLAGGDLLLVLDPASDRLRVFEAQLPHGPLAHFLAVPFLWRQPTHTLDDYLVIAQVLL